MRRIVFYSWQSDSPNACNRGLIQTALEEAAIAITADDTVAIEPVVDRDTQDVPGAPDITSTIFAKIAAADVFVSDVSITTRGKGKRPTPNPNVLIELGYALRALGHERIILVFNRAFGKLEELPFDLRTRRVLTYVMPQDSAERAPERKRLERQLDGAIRAALESVPQKEDEVESPVPAIAAIESLQPNRAIVLRRNLAEILNKIDEGEPKKFRDGGTPEKLIEGIRATQGIVAEFSRIVESVAVMNDEIAGVEIVRWFGKLLERYDLPEGFSGEYSEADHDYFRFVGHELFTTLIAFPLREQRWGLLRLLFGEPIAMNYMRPDGPGNVGWEYASQHCVLLANEGQKRGRISFHGDLLNERHSIDGGLGTILPIEDFIGADFFLFLLSQSISDTKNGHFDIWRPWSCVFMKRAPMFLQNAARAHIAIEIGATLGANSIEELKGLLAEKGPELRRLFRAGSWHYPIRNEDIERIGTL